MYNYKRMEELLKRKGINKSDLTDLLGISSRTLAKIKKGEKLSDLTLNKIASFLSCSPDDLYRIVSNNHLLQTLREEKNAGISGGLYHEIQIRMAYNSNHMEGSMLSEVQTRMIFETRTIGSDEYVSVDDVIEASNHFRAFDYMLDIAERTLSEDIIKHFHFLLKRGTVESDISWFALGDYKKKPNVVGGKETVSPIRVSDEMKSLLKQYNSKSPHDINDIIEFHYLFETIHPFQDGNGRVGRLIAFKECLKNNITPFIIEDSKKAFYYRGLKEYTHEKGYLIDTCLDGQDTFTKLMNMFKE